MNIRFSQSSTQYTAASPGMIEQTKSLSVCALRLQTTRTSSQLRHRDNEIKAIAVVVLYDTKWMETAN